MDCSTPGCPVHHQLPELAQTHVHGVSDATVNYKLALTKGIANDRTTKAFAICLYRDWTPCCYSCWPSATPEGVQGGVRHSVLQGIWWDRCLDSWMFLGTDFMISVLASPLNPFMETSDPQDWQKPFCKMSALWYWTPPSSKPYILTFPTAALEQSVSQSYPHFAPNKA